MRILAILLSVALLTPGSASAGMFGDYFGTLGSKLGESKPNMQFGPLKVSPYYKFAQTYQSNIYLVPENGPNGAIVGGGKVGSWITENNLGVRLALPLNAIHGFEGGYDLQSLLYSKQPSANDALNQAADLAYVYAGPSGLSAKVWDKYIDTMDPAFSETADRQRRTQNTLGGSTEYDPEGGMLFAGVNVDHTAHEYKNNAIGNTLNRYEQNFGFRAGYKVMPKTRLYAGYTRQIIDYTVEANARNSKSHLMNLGVEGQIAPKVTGQLQGGLILRDYDNSVGGLYGYNRNWGVQTQLEYKPQERCSIELQLSRALQEATFGANRFYVSTFSQLAFKHQFPGKLSAGVDLGMTIDRFPQAATTGGVTAYRHDEIYMQRASLDYALRDYLSLGGSYQHLERFSTFSGQFNYEDHRTTLQAKLVF